MTALEEGRLESRPDGRASAWRLRTRLVRGGTMRSEFGETCEALYLTSGYCYDRAEEAEARFKGEDEGFVYSRYGNPTVAMFEERMALLEGADAAWATGSGMAAVSASLLCQLRAGDYVVGARALFGSCRYVLEEILPRFGIEVTLVDGHDLDQWRSALRPGTACVFFETPANPTLDLVDIAAVSGLAHEVGARVIVDNVFSTAVLQRPLELGADIVVYSATKHIDGQGRCLGGAVLADAAFCDQELQPFLRHTGPAMSPFNAWIMLKGLETLDLRLERHCANAAQIADFLHAHAAVERLLFPGRPDHPQYDLARAQMDGPGSIVVFDVPGGKAGAFRVLNALELIDISNNLGDAKSLITHPASTTHQRLAPAERAHLRIGDGMLRLSVGLEDTDDLEEDLARALAAL